MPTLCMRPHCDDPALFAVEVIAVRAGCERPAVTVTGCSSAHITSVLLPLVDPGNGATEKRCTGCQAAKPISEFGLRSDSADGRLSRCKDCVRARTAAWRAQNPDVDAAIKARWVERHPDRKRAADDAWRRRNPERFRAYYAARYQRHAATRRAASRRAYRAHPERAAAYMRARRQAYPQLYREYSSRRRARLMAAVVVPVTSEQWAQKLAYWGHRCWMCGAPCEATDHVKPLIKGGPHLLANLRPACGACNSSKSSRWPFPTNRVWF